MHMGPCEGRKESAGSWDLVRDVLLVVFVDRRQPDVEVVHLISARKAVDYEESIYKDQFR